MEAAHIFCLVRRGLTDSEYLHRKSVAAKHGCKFVYADLRDGPPTSWFEGPTPGEPFAGASAVQAELEEPEAAMEKERYLLIDMWTECNSCGRAAGLRNWSDGEVVELNDFAPHESVVLDDETPWAICTTCRSQRECDVEEES